MKRNLFVLATSSLLFLLMACSPAGPSTISVNGKVVGSNGQPVSAAPVVITTNGSTLSTTTNSSGAFSVSGVVAPYDASVISGTQALVYKGLNRTDPTLVFLSVLPGASKSATLSGVVSGGAGFPEPASHQTRVAFGSPEANDSTLAASVSGAYNMGSVSWFGPTTTSGNIHALQWLFDASGFPTDYKGYGSKTGVALSDGGTFSSQNIVMAGVSEASISGSITLPTGYNLTTKRLSIGFGDRSLIQVLSDSGVSNNFTYTTPNIAGASAQIRTQASNAAGTTLITVKPGLGVNASGVSIAPPAGSDLSLPPNAATNINTSTVFSYTPFSGGVHFVIFQGAGPTYVVITKDANTSIPNLSSVGLALPTSAAYTWRVVGMAPFANTDAAAASDGWISVFSGTAEGNVSQSSTRAFSTAP